MLHLGFERAHFKVLTCGLLLGAFHSRHYLIDTHCGMIVDVEATSAYRTAEVDATRTMIDRVEERFNLTPDRLLADMAYGGAATLAWLVDEKGIESHIPVWDKSERADGSFLAATSSATSKIITIAARQANCYNAKRRIFKAPRTGDAKTETIRP